MSLWLAPQTLGRLRPEVARPNYDRNALGRGIVHLGPGAFHRVHQAWYVERLLEHDPRWGITAVSLHSRAVRDALAPQSGLYTLAVLDADTHFEVLGSIRELLVAPEAAEAVNARLASPETRVVTLTVTEKAYCLDATGRLDPAHPDIVQDLAHPHAPRSVLGLLVHALRRRHAAGLRPFVTLCCDNLADNGAKLRAAVIEFAQASDPALAAWIAGEALFPRTMVDSITPATTDELRERVARVTGLRDRWPVQREAFLQWVIEAHDDPQGPDWAASGATIAADVSAFERAKLRLLNGAHSTLAYLGVLAGHSTVAQAIGDARLAAFVRAMMLEDILPTTSSSLDGRAYIERVLERFRNPAMVHKLAQIAWDGSQKLPVRILGTVRDALAVDAPLARLVVPLAAWMHFVRLMAADAQPLTDPLAERLLGIGQACDGDATRDVERFLELRNVFGDDLATQARFRRELEAAYQRVARWPAGEIT